MDNFPGIISLFLACIELVLLINLLIFAEKNRVNIHIMVLVVLLFGYQLFEFMICYFELQSNLIIYLAFFIITMLPPLMLNIVLTILDNNSSIQKFTFIPAVLLLAYYPLTLSDFVVTRCTIIFAAYDIPFADLYGIIYYLPVVISLFLLGRMIVSEKYRDQKLNLIIVTTGIVLTFIPTAIIILGFPVLIEFIESFFCKSAFIIALSFTIFAMRNKDEVKINE